MTRIAAPLYGMLLLLVRWLVFGVSCAKLSARCDVHGVMHCLISEMHDQEWYLQHLAVGSEQSLWPNNT